MNRVTKKMPKLIELTFWPEKIENKQYIINK